MSEIKLLILPEVVKQRTTLHTNIDNKLIYPEIKAVQDTHIQPLLGSVLFNKILKDISDGTLACNYLALMDNFIIDCICNYVMSELPEAINYQYWNKGVATKTTDNSQAPTMSDMYAIVSKYKTRAEHYSQACRLYLVQNQAAMFPEYYAAGGVDRVYPDRATYTSPIYLGGRNRGCTGRANHNPNINSNDPYIDY